MKAKEHAKNDDINLQADALTDLPVTDEQAEQTKAGAICHGVSVLAWARVDGQSEASPQLMQVCATGEQ